MDNPKRQSNSIKDRDNWGFKIRKYRESRGLTQSELAQLSGTSASHISRIENGDFPTMTQSTAEKLSKGFNLSVESLRTIVYGISDDRRQTPEEALERLKLTIPVSVPVYSEYPFRPGRGVKIMDYTYEDKTRNIENLEAYLILRNSSMDPEIKLKDIIMVRRNASSIPAGSYVVCLVGDKMVLGQLKIIAGEKIIENNEGQFKYSDCRETSVIVKIIRDFDLQQILK